MKSFRHVIRIMNTITFICQNVGRKKKKKFRTAIFPIPQMVTLIILAIYI